MVLSDGTVTNYYKGTKQVLKYDKSGKLISDQTYNMQNIQKQHIKNFKMITQIILIFQNFANQMIVINLANSIKNSLKNKSDKK